ncbi:MAG: MATE family efflux transporter [Clostridia bacterium]|nr:MATE family efflux transporter [Clostridia bacterium]
MVNLFTKFKELFAPRDMCVGAPWKRIAEFAFPMLLGNFAQQLYNTVDAVVVGNSKWGEAGLGAVGNAGPIINLLLALFVGISTGAGIMVSQFFGARDREKLSKTIGNCISITAIACVIIMIAGPLLTTPLLKAMNTMPDMFDASRDYLMIAFIGTAGFFFYNIFSGILRGLGDSLSALGFLVLTSVINVVLDLLFVDKMGVAGVALATVIAQFISAILCLIKLICMRNLFDINKRVLKIEKGIVLAIVKLGLPSGITQAIFSAAMMLVQSLINGFGDLLFVTCNIMVMRVDGYAMLPNFSFGQAMSTYVGQNVGAKRIDRIGIGTKQGLIMSLATALILTPLVLVGGPWLMGLFTPNQQLIDLSMTMMYIICIGYIAMAITQVLSGVMRGAGDTMAPMWISFATTVIVRVPLAYTLVYIAKNMGAELLTQEKMVFVSLLASWMLGMLITVVLYLTGGWKKRQVNAIAAELKSQGKSL